LFVPSYTKIGHLDYMHRRLNLKQDTDGRTDGLADKHVQLGNRVQENKY